VSLAEETRKDLVDIFESIHCTIVGSHTLGTITFVQIGKHEYKDIIFDGYTRQNFKAKLKAGLLLNTLISEQIDDYKCFSKNVVAHIENIELAALNFFDAACTLSANITTSTEVNLNSDSKIEKYIGKHGDVEALYQYGLIALKLKGRRELKAKAMKRLEYAANRGSIGAQIILGQVLISEYNRYTDGIKYLNLAKESGCEMALVVLYKVHAQEGNSYSNLPYALECLYSAVELGVTLAKSLLAIEYLVGDHIESDYQKAILLLDEAIAEGSLEAIYAKTTYLNCQLEELNERISNLSSNTTSVSGSTIKNSQSPNLKQKTPGRNDPCICGSTKKYKKCCMNGNSHQTPHNALN
jgi:TPR repeat protein